MVLMHVMKLILPAITILLLLEVKVNFDGIKTLKSLPCDIFLGAHAMYFDLKKKYDSLKTNSTNPFVDSQGYKNHIAQKEKEFYNEKSIQNLR